MIITIKTLVFKLHHFIKSGTPNKVTYNSILLVFDLLFQFYNTKIERNNLRAIKKIYIKNNKMKYNYLGIKWPVWSINKLYKQSLF